jgi:hypothetical protein
MNTLTIDGKNYPVRITMGALVNFKRGRGVDFAAERANDMEDICYFMYECVRSACRVDRIDFALSFEEFIDKISPAELLLFQNQNGEEEDKGKSSKKK